MNTYTALIYREGELYVAECPEIGSVSQGKSIEQAVENLRIATELYLEETQYEPKSRALITTFNV